MIDYKIVLSQQLRLLLPMILKLIAIIGVIYLTGYQLTFLLLVLLFFFIFLIDVLPTLIVHIQYVVKNYNKLITLDIQKKTISCHSGDIIRKKSFDDVASIKYYSSFVRPSGWHSFGEYRYYQIIFNDSTAFVVTCLMVNRIEDNFGKFLPIEAEKCSRLIALIY